MVTSPCCAIINASTVAGSSTTTGPVEDGTASEGWTSGWPKDSGLTASGDCSVTRKESDRSRPYFFDLACVTTQMKSVREVYAAVSGSVFRRKSTPLMDRENSNFKESTVVQRGRHESHSNASNNCT